ncbi:MAG: PH domain-containing protein [Lysobacterales bacterium]|nr:PH domain-containing protein [Xanthomonadales bacterium]MCB1614330.1 PH domain-containing protein [Xanthomonadales bacterium]MCP5475839.1 PH domain-containing protein [Rhodanobacteraceae bacterium]
MNAIEFQAVDERAPRLWIWQARLGALPLPIGLAVLLSAWSLPLALVAAVALAVLLVWMTSRVVHRHYQHLRYALNEDGFFLRHGVWWQSEIFVPRDKIQHVDVVVGPIARRYGLAQLSFYTAGAHVPHVQVSGLAAERAMQLRDTLLSAGNQPSLAGADQGPA